MTSGNSCLEKCLDQEHLTEVYIHKMEREKTGGEDLFQVIIKSN